MEECTHKNKKYVTENREGVYEGEWKSNNMHEYGVYTWKDGRKHEGIF